MLKRIVCFLPLLFLISCNVLQPPPDLAWDHDPEAVIIQTSEGGGLEPPAAGYNRIPNGKVWGDGRIVWTTFDDGKRSVWQAQLSEVEMMALLETFADKGFWRLEDFYQPSDEVFDSTTTSLSVNLLAERKRVGEYHAGAPREFDELIGLVRSVGDANKEVYVPQQGYLSVDLLSREPSNAAELPVWDAASAGLSLAEIDGNWVEGAALQQAWEIVNLSYWAPRVVEDGKYYELILEMPELTGREPSS